MGKIISGRWKQLKEYHPETTGELDDLLKLCYFCLLRMVGSLGTSVSSRWSLFIEFLIRTFYMSFPTFQCSSIPVTACQVSSADQTGPPPLPAWPRLSRDTVLLEPFSLPPFCSSVLPCSPVSCWFLPFSWSLALGCLYIHFLVETIYISWLYYHLYWRPKFISPTYLLWTQNSQIAYLMLCFDIWKVSPP